MLSAIIDQKKSEFRTCVDHFLHELNSVRTGRANPGLLATVLVESYGSAMPLEHVANVGVQDSKTLVITPWDKSQMAAIEKGIQAANIGLNPSSDGQVIRIILPAMTEERRKEMAKSVGQMLEKARVSVRGVREEIIKEMKKMEGESGISKDEVVDAQADLQKIVDAVNAEIKEFAETKEKEIMTI